MHIIKFKIIDRLLKKIYDNRRSDSLASELRKRRIIFLESLITSIPTPLKILDVGGRPVFWKESGFFKTQNFREIEITFINIEQLDEPEFLCITGDAKNMNQFKNQEFDVVFSNSVIEHVGDYKDQHQMANELRRVGKRYFVQTPNLYFPVEPHFLFPFFQFLSIDIRVWLLTHFNMGWYPKMTDEQEARTIVTQTRLLSKTKLVNLFPEATIYEEKIFGLTKSLIAYYGW
jgi:hypothetical protein